MPHLHRQSLVAARLVLVMGGRLVPQALRTLFHFEKLSRDYLIYLTLSHQWFPYRAGLVQQVKKREKEKRAVVRFSTPKGATCWGYFYVFVL